MKATITHVDRITRLRAQILDAQGAAGAVRLWLQDPNLDINERVTGALAALDLLQEILHRRDTPSREG